MKEKDFQTRFTRWLRYRWSGSGAFELKICHEKSLPFDAVQPHQEAALLAASDTGLEYKIPDDTRGSKPFDCFKLCAPAFVVVMFYERGTNHFYLISIEVWLFERANSTRKSLTEERAREIGKLCEFK